ncbi:MAG: hypothetical protein GC155_15655 [Alphaproteobacteria bacterium]|nr:hypothetical protein [Alphaproteobacteria bacterium]
MKLLIAACAATLAGACASTGPQQQLASNDVACSVNLGSADAGEFGSRTISANRTEHSLCKSGQRDIVSDRTAFLRGRTYDRQVRRQSLR